MGKTRIIKRIAGGLLAGCAAYACMMGAYAAEGKLVSDWTNLPGYTFYDGPQGTKQRAAAPAKVARTAEGIQMTSDGYYKVGVQAFSGLIYKEKLNLETLSFEILFNQVPGVDSSGGGTDDLWFTFAFMDRPEMFFSQSTDKGGKGLVANLRPGKRDILNQMFTHINDPGSSQGWKTLSSATIKADPPAGSRLLFEFRKQGSYINLYINNKKQANVWSNLMSQTFPDKTGYLALATSTDTAKDFTVTVTKLNGVSLGDPAAAASSSAQGGASSVTGGGTASSKAAGGSSSRGAGAASSGAAQSGGSGASEGSLAPGAESGSASSADPAAEVPSGAEKVALENAIRSAKSAVTVKAGEGVIQLKKPMSMKAVRDALELEEGYRFVYYDINNEEIKDESADVTVLTSAILYFGADVEKIFTFTVDQSAGGAPGSGPVWPWILLGAAVLAGAGTTGVLMLRRKRCGV